MATSSLGDLRQRMATIFNEARFKNYKLEDVMPAEMQDHFNSLVEIRTTKAYVLELEKREETLKEQTYDLSKALEVEKEKMNNLPGDFEQMQLDLKQEQRQVAFYQNLFEAEEKRAEDYKRRYQNAVQQQGTIADASAKIDELKKQVHQYQNSVVKFAKKNRELEDTHNALEARIKEVEQQKDEKLLAKQRQIDQLLAEYQQLEAEKTEFEDTYNTLTESLSDENGDSAQQINSLTVRISALNMEAEKEMRLKNSILSMCHAIFKQIMTQETSKGLVVSGTLKANLEDAADQYEAFQHVLELFQSESPVDEELYQVLIRMSDSTKELQDVLQTIPNDLDKFLQHRGHRLLVILKKELAGYGRNRYR